MIEIDILELWQVDQRVNSTCEIDMERTTADKLVIKEKELPTNWESFWCNEDLRDGHETTLTYSSLKDADAAMGLCAIRCLVKHYNKGYTFKWGEDSYPRIELEGDAFTVRHWHLPGLLSFVREGHAKHFIKHHSDLLSIASPLLFGVSV